MLLGTKRGRTSGVRFGYSQVANPIYLISKGTMSITFGTGTMLSNILANIAKMPAPEPYIDRAGRVVGNFRALRDMLLGRLHPTRILDF